MENSKMAEWKAIAEALLFAAGDEGLSIRQLSEVLEIDERETADVLEALKESYSHTERGIMLTGIAGVYQLATKKTLAQYLKKLVENPGPSSLSQAALETLAIVAYKQPITRTEIEEIRGVKTERPLQTLVTKAIIKEVGRAEGSGRAILYGTTREFLEYFGLESIDDLPPLPESADDEGDQEEADLFFEKFNETLNDLK